MRNNHFNPLNPNTKRPEMPLQHLQRSRLPFRITGSFIYSMQDVKGTYACQHTLSRLSLTHTVADTHGTVVDQHVTVRDSSSLPSLPGAAIK